MGTSATAAPVGMGRQGAMGSGSGGGFQKDVSPVKVGDLLKANQGGYS